MLIRAVGRKHVKATAVVFGVIASLGIQGCGRQGAQDEAAATNTKSGEPASVDMRMHQPFTAATTSEPTGDWQRPPELTMTGKSVGKIYTEVVKKWNDIRFIDPNGSRLAYRATVDTELGSIEIALRPDLAPNHVRSFVALAQCGYYDGLVFQRAINQQIPERAGDKLEIIEAGCPLGTGEPGYGSVGYWLKPEPHTEGIHDEGTVGACHGDQADTAACKFYINLNKAPFLDGHFTVFGKVTNGLPVARKILSLPVRNDPEYPEQDRPVRPVVIRKVTIHAEEMAPK